MGPGTPPDQPGGPHAGLLRRAALQVACAQRALPAWERLRPADRRPRALIAAVIPALHGEHEEAEVITAYEVMAASFAGQAALKLGDTWDGDLDPTLVPTDTLNRDRDPDVHLVEFLAALALALDDADGMRAFWRSYVSEAFPAAYASVP